MGFMMYVTRMVYLWRM